MKFTLIIQSGPQSGSASRSALLFAKAVLAAGHSIYRVFFYGDGVQNSTQLSVTPQDEQDTAESWARFIKEHHLDAVVCIATALKRGLLDKSEAERHGRPGHNLAPVFELAGLGQLVDGAVRADRVITFGD